MRRPSITLKCPVYDAATMDNVCDQEIEVDAWPAERMTHWYPGSPAGFEVVEADCGHAGVIEDKYYDTIMEQLADRERSASEYAIDAMIERRIDQVWARGNRA